MNTESVQSFPAGGVIAAHKRVKINAAGEAVLAGAGDHDLGTNLQDVSNDPSLRNIAAVQLKNCGSHYVTVGDATAIAVGDELEAAAGGDVIKKGAGAAIMQALEAAAGAGRVIRAVYL